ncbi:uncharacterized protein (TIGR03083 family) [Spinactinospora alkalitolerans]|uniref:Uncharacterized protein (TIGR03083 family) n=1 Tax=Spinactinospora alkalitolerans TaxID=687207 RepID=A0A852TZI0_9ACTN|nr:maleylpyruvate isomerase family mycothiol-dependent enzyme [Spinactinospora alkalitolerans]NYE49399.1 uncharacterized protein (TIGR03083 family) [Spinactinospora alkalitolerans]
MSDSALGPAIDARPLFTREQERLLALLDGLSAEQWRAPTACAGWSVRDLAPHILGDHLGRLSGGRDGHARSAPREGEAFNAFIHRVNDEWVPAAARISPRLLVEMLTDAAARIAAYWESVDLHATGLPVSWAGPEAAPMWLDCARDYTEYWVHQQQIREAVGAPRLDEPRFRAPVVDAFMRALPHALRDVRPPEGTRVRYAVTGDSGGAWTATRSAGRWALERGDGGGQEPDAALTTDADTFWRLCTRDTVPEEARPLVVREGDEALTEAAARMVSIIV